MNRKIVIFVVQSILGKYKTLREKSGQQAFTYARDMALKPLRKENVGEILTSASVRLSVDKIACSINCLTE